MACDDPTCPGCLSGFFVDTLKDEGWAPDDIIRLFFSQMSESFPESGYVLEEVTAEPVEGSIH